MCRFGSCNNSLVRQDKGRSREERLAINTPESFCINPEKLKKNRRNRVQKRLAAEKSAKEASREEQVRLCANKKIKAGGTPFAKTVGVVQTFAVRRKKRRAQRKRNKAKIHDRRFVRA